MEGAYELTKDRFVIGLSRSYINMYAVCSPSDGCMFYCMAEEQENCSYASEALEHCKDIFCNSVN